MYIQTTDKGIAAKVAEDLLKIGAIKLNVERPFQWSSGWKSPVYCDNRMALSYPEVRNSIKKYLAKYVSDYFPDAEAIAGVATAGIPQGALVADLLSLPFSYVRSKPKGHGMENLIEGRVEAGSRVVVIEDLISTGGSSLKAVQALRNHGAEVQGLLAIFNYGFSVADKTFKDAGVKTYSLSNYAEMLPGALASGYFDENQLLTLEEWREKPESWGK